MERLNVLGLADSLMLAIAYGVGQLSYEFFATKSKRTRLNCFGCRGYMAVIRGLLGHMRES